jgi:hypothetical protein
MLKSEGMSPEEAARRTAWSVGPRASIPEKTAESLGERVGDAYSDPGSATQTRGKAILGCGLQGQPDLAIGNAGRPVLAVGQQFTEVISRRLGEQPFLMTAAGFAMGYVTAVYFTTVSMRISVRRGSHFKLRRRRKADTHEASCSGRFSKSSASTPKG